MMLREGIFCGGYLGIMPVVREEITRRYPHSYGSTDDRARLCATVIAGPICSFLSHPPDTIKTVMQGDGRYHMDDRIGQEDYCSRSVIRKKCGTHRACKPSAQGP